MRPLDLVLLASVPSLVQICTGSGPHTTEIVVPFAFMFLFKVITFLLHMGYCHLPIINRTSQLTWFNQFFFTFLFAFKLANLVHCRKKKHLCFYFYWLSLTQMFCSHKSFFPHSYSLRCYLTANNYFLVGNGSTGEVLLVVKGQSYEACARSFGSRQQTGSWRDAASYTHGYDVPSGQRQQEQKKKKNLGRAVARAMRQPPCRFLSIGRLPSQPLASAKAAGENA